jgi:hypothetical protein
MMDFGISYSKKFDGENLSVVLNCGDSIVLPDNTILGNFQSGLYRNTEFKGDKLVIVKIGENLEVSDKVAGMCRSRWTPVYELFPIEQFRNADLYRSSTVKLGDFTFNLWYFGEHLPGSLHKEHDFYETHTQILGRGEMQKFHKEDERTLYERTLLSPGQTHRPFFDSHRSYPCHRYRAISKSILLSIESPYSIPKE